MGSIGRIWFSVLAVLIALPATAQIYQQADPPGGAVSAGGVADACWRGRWRAGAQAALGQRVIVDNKPGAGGVSAPDRRQGRALMAIRCCWPPPAS